MEQLVILCHIVSKVNVIKQKNEDKVEEESTLTQQRFWEIDCEFELLGVLKKAAFKSPLYDNCVEQLIYSF